MEIFKWVFFCHFFYNDDFYFVVITILKIDVFRLLGYFMMIFKNFFFLMHELLFCAFFCVYFDQNMNFFLLSNYAHFSILKWQIWQLMGWGGWGGEREVGAPLTLIAQRQDMGKCFLAQIPYSLSFSPFPSTLSFSLYFPLSFFSSYSFFLHMIIFSYGK